MYKKRVSNMYFGEFDSFVLGHILVLNDIICERLRIEVKIISERHFYDIEFCNGSCFYMKTVVKQKPKMFQNKQIPQWVGLFSFTFE